MSTLQTPKALASSQLIRNQLAWNRLLSVVEEQAQVLIHTAFGTSTREAGDLSAGVFLPDGRMIAQAVTGTPGHVNSMAESVKHFLRRFPVDTMEDGDVYLTNDPWKGTGHLFDMTMVTPVFHGEGAAKKVVALFASTLHVVDIGGIGSSPDGLEIYHEGLFLPILRFVRQGTVDPAVRAIIRANVRDPEQVEGDLYALVACNEVGGRRLRTLLREFRFDDLEALGDFVIARSAQAMREALRDWPRGTWHNTLVADGYDAPITLQVSVTIADDGIVVDYAGTSGTVARGINVVKAYTDAYTSFGIRCLVGSDVPNNAGSLGLIRVEAPAGCILNALHPAAVTARHVVGQLLPDAVFGALRQARADKVPAEGASSLWNLQLVGGEVLAGTSQADAEAVRRGARFNVISFSTGGTGARPGKDGLSVTAYPSGVRNVSLEILETQAPVVFERKEFRTDSGGTGAVRGGLGQVIEVRHAQPDAAFLIAAAFDRVDNPARGALGGGDGAPGRLRLASGATLRAKGRQIVPAGDRLVVETPGGGGLGEPSKRDPALVARDLREGLVSAEASAASVRAGAASLAPVTA
ncbi:hydantoinase B/oxoprolinase family protein [Variovorax sp. J22G73]|uniref:hydantoinase B/oxoprolinase family protein n=1 Tax=unclassified Variovorax TaxID=663243 RepID=UPI002574F337|nr:MULTISPECIES: hydantoinase B/oxoprolinase family protein [unclassified Variovorax]MDM0005845.1 hydantoinase B/oxoprolinase family protein [Variovorax sp. J22R203]MDM0099872.1 hydantoinase B/oxoprolinase family protein [Variovorax sp. J22G73]